ncbi:MAG TPA: SRPBCC family protein [Actinomycetota bacterium]|jgi:uncharacterized protein YndB with AHSA1/START domain|nr:SRPBCC family protein [Actinomycetota bacterium]
MAPMVSSIEIVRPPGEVYAYVTDPSRFGEWQRDVVAVRIEGGRPGGAGSRFTTTRRIGGSDRSMTQEVTEADAPRRWAARAVGGPVRPSATVTVEPLGDGTGSRVTFTLDFEGHGLGRSLLPLVRRQAQRAAPVSYRTLKERLERGDDLRGR